MMALEPANLKKRWGFGLKGGIVGGRFVFTAVMQVVSRSSTQRGSRPDLRTLLTAFAASYPKLAHDLIGGGEYGIIFKGD
jgi:hypothetical protein